MRACNGLGASLFFLTKTLLLFVLRDVQCIHSAMLQRGPSLHPMLQYGGSCASHAMKNVLHPETWLIVNTALEEVRRRDAEGIAEANAEARPRGEPDADRVPGIKAVILRATTENPNGFELEYVMADQKMPTYDADLVRRDASNYEKADALFLTTDELEALYANRPAECVEFRKEKEAEIKKRKMAKAEHPHGPGSSPWVEEHSPCNLHAILFNTLRRILQLLRYLFGGGELVKDQGVSPKFQGSWRFAFDHLQRMTEEDQEELVSISNTDGANAEVVLRRFRVFASNMRGAAFDPSFGHDSTTADLRWMVLNLKGPDSLGESSLFFTSQEQAIFKVIEFLVMDVWRRELPAEEIAQGDQLEAGGKALVRTVDSDLVRKKIWEHELGLRSQSAQSIVVTEKAQSTALYRTPSFPLYLSLGPKFGYWAYMALRSSNLTVPSGAHRTTQKARWSASKPSELSPFLAVDIMERFLALEEGGHGVVLQGPSTGEGVQATTTGAEQKSSAQTSQTSLTAKTEGTNTKSLLERDSDTANSEKNEEAPASIIWTELREKMGS